MTDVSTVRTLLAPFDPALPVADNPAHDAIGRATLARILATPRTEPPGRASRERRPRPNWRWAVVVVPAAIVAIVVVGGAVILFPDGGDGPAANAATPPVLPFATTSAAPGGPVLQRIAAAAQRQPAPTGSGPYRYVRTEGWALHTAVSGGTTTSALVSHQSEAWRTPDGHGVIRTTGGESLVDRIGSQATLDAVLTKPGAGEIVLGQGSYVLEPLADLDTLPYDEPAAFADAVQHHRGTGIPVGTDVAEAIATLFRQEPVPPIARAKVWRLLAGVPGVVYRGELTDRLGRSGAAITVDDDGSAHGLPERFLFIVDRSTGALLEYDVVLTTDPGKLNVKVPAVIELTVYLGAGRVADVGVRPPLSSTPSAPAG